VEVAQLEVRHKVMPIFVVGVGSVVAKFVPDNVTRWRLLVVAPLYWTLVETTGASNVNTFIAVTM
jgi:hypothetical protein